MRINDFLQNLKLNNKKLSLSLVLFNLFVFYRKNKIEIINLLKK